MTGSLAYHWRRSPRAKSLQVKITPWQGIEVVIPRHVSRERARAFVAQHRQWIRNTWERMHEQVLDAHLSMPATLDLPALGEHWQVCYLRRAGSTARVTENGGVLTVRFNGEDERGAREALRQWLKRHARDYFLGYLPPLCELIGLEFRRLQIRGQSGRWGSCSSNKTLSLNYKLLFLEPELVRYLIVHELVHLRHLNHSARFWAMVERFEPRCRELDAELGECWRDVPAWVEMQ